jgi:hypothetical protein
MPDETNETAAIVGIYGAVDRAVYENRENRTLREEVAQLLPPYKDPELRWYDESLQWWKEEAEARGEQPDEAAGEPFPEAPAALAQLASAAPPRPRMRARRMFALAVLARALPEMKEPGHELRALAIEALRVIPAGPPGTEPSENQAEDLYKLLSGEDQDAVEGEEGPGTDPWWIKMVRAGISTKVLPNDTGAYPRPCISGMVRVPGVDGPVDALATQFENDKIAFERATRYLEPLNWRTCRPDFWCTVDFLEEPSKGQRLYHEVVSTHCGEPARGGFWAETDLLVNFMLVSDRRNGRAAIANYRLANPPQPEDFIQVDEGSLVVAQAPDTKALRISSTKRVKFNREIPTGWCAIWMCILGYGDAAADLIACAAREGIDPPRGTEFPGVPLPPRPDGGGPPAAGPLARRSQAPRGGLVQEVADIWARTIRDGAAALERNLGGAGQGSAPRRRGPGG